MQLFFAGSLIRLRLKTRFLLILGFAALCFSLAIWGVYSSIVDRLVTRIGIRLAEKQVLYDKSRTLQPLIREVALARQMADSSAINRWARNEHDPQLRSAALAEMEKFRKNFQDGSCFLALSGSGHYYFNNATSEFRGKELRYTLKPDQHDDAWFFATIKSRGDYYINVDPDTRLGVTKVWINVLLRDGNQVLGVLGTGLDLTRFINEVADAGQPGVHNLFIDGNGAIQIHRDIELIDFSTIAKSNDRQRSINSLLDKAKDKEWVHQAIRQLDHHPQEVVTKFIELKGKHYLAGMAALPEIGWYDVTLLDLGVVMPARDFMEMGFAIGGTVLSLLLILAMTLDRLVLRPVNFLTEAARKIRQGAHMDAPSSEATGELSEMALRFFDMSDNLQSEKAVLEVEVEKRTRQIADAQKVLEATLQQEKDGRLTQANLLVMMAHEFRNPVAVIGNTAQSLQVLTESAQPDWLPRINKITVAVRRISLLLDNLLAEERLSEFYGGLEREFVELNTYCRDLAASLGLMHGRTIRVEDGGEPASLWVDRQLLGIAISNLIDNAIKYSPSDSEVILRVHRANQDHLCIEVSDKGPGISMEMQDIIFDKFKRGQNTSNISGAGLGLYLVNWIAMLHGGKISLETSSDSGSTFRLTFSARSCC